MSEFLHLYKRGADKKDVRLLDKHLEQDHIALQRQGDFAGRFTVGAPKLPEAQIVYSPLSGRCGVAVQGGRYVCELPRGYEGQGLELAVIDDGRLIATHPNHPPLLVDPGNGTTRPL